MLCYGLLHKVLVKCHSTCIEQREKQISFKGVDKLEQKNSKIKNLATFFTHFSAQEHLININFSSIQLQIHDYFWQF